MAVGGVHSDDLSDDRPTEAHTHTHTEPCLRHRAVDRRAAGLSHAVPLYMHMHMHIKSQLNL
jgi:hypothetical protein